MRTEMTVREAVCCSGSTLAGSQRFVCTLISSRALGLEKIIDL
jgi:hypothetical protein